MLSLLSCLFLLSFAAVDANAGQVLKCEKRIKKERSKISVEVEDLVPGALYTATVSSGENTKLASQAADLVGVAEFDFDSNAKDILAGATAIPANFIVATVNTVVTDALGAVVLETSATCKVKK